MTTVDDNEIIGKISATEKNPSTFDEFYFWTKAGYNLSPFDVVKVEHIPSSPEKGKSFTYGIIEEISHVTDSASHFASYISSDFGNLTSNKDGNTDRIAFNYVKARVIGNTQNVYTPVLHNQCVTLCSSEDIELALGLDEKSVKNPLVCGYLEMYGKQVPVRIDANFLVGPDGAHLNISGISGLACKTSYSMFLMNALQQKYAKLKEKNSEKAQKVGYVVFNVKGRDLLSIDENAEKIEDKEIYDTLGLEAKPFSNVHYYYPYSDRKEMNYMQTFADQGTTIKKQKDQGICSTYKYTYESCKDKLSYMFANEDDTTGTMESIISYIENDNQPFNGANTWAHLTDRIDQVIDSAPDSPAKKQAQMGSWKKFNRIINKILSDKVFADNINDDGSEVILADSIKDIKDGEVKVIDIARLDDRAQAFVFGDVIGTIIEMMNTKVGDDALDKIVIFVDELNKYASSEVPSSSPILHHLLDITERGRSLGIILFAVEQFKSAIHRRIKGNCATSAYGRTNDVEAAAPEYGFLGKTYKSMMTRLSPGEYIVQNPALHSLIKIKFPHPTYKQNS